jgi:uncharacterized protein (TIGR03435 family)
MREPVSVSGGPVWLDSDTFDVEAKTEATADKDQLRQMLQRKCRFTS